MAQQKKKAKTLTDLLDKSARRSPRSPLLELQDLLSERSAESVIDDYNRFCHLIEAVISADGRKREKIGELIGLHYQAMWRRKNNPSMWTPEELHKLRKVLNIP